MQTRTLAQPLWSFSYAMYNSRVCRGSVWRRKCCQLLQHFSKSFVLSTSFSTFQSENCSPLMRNFNGTQFKKLHVEFFSHSLHSVLMLLLRQKMGFWHQEYTAAAPTNTPVSSHFLCFQRWDRTLLTNALCNQENASTLQKAQKNNTIFTLSVNNLGPIGLRMGCVCVESRTRRLTLTKRMYHFLRDNPPFF